MKASHCFPVSIVLDEKLSVNFYGVSLVLNFLLLLFKISSLSLALRSFVMMCLQVNLFGFFSYSEFILYKMSNIQINVFNTNLGNVGPFYL